MSCNHCALTVASLEDGWVPVILDPDTAALPCQRGELELFHDERVVVETPDGPFIGKVSLYCTPIVRTPEVRSGRVLRRPTDEDLSREENARGVAGEMERYLKSRVAQLGLNLRPLKVRIPLVGSRAVVYFSSEQRVDFRRLVKEMARYRPSILVNVPSLYMMLLEAEGFSDLDFSNLKFCLSGASPFPAESIKELEEAAELKPDQIMLDNFSTAMLQTAAETRIESALEVSGNLTVENAGHLPAKRQWFLSSGALTKHVTATDLSLRLQVLR